MSKKTAESLWLMMNKFRGTFEINELCKLMAYSAFLKYVELKQKSQNEKGNSFPSYDKTFSVGFLSLTYGELTFAADIEKYVNKIENDLGLDSHIAEDMGLLLAKAPKEAVKAVFRILHESSFENLDELQEVVQALFDKSAYMRGNFSMDLSNHSLCKLEAKLLDCEEGMSVYDGFCGFGESVNQAANKKGIVYLQDVRLSSIAIATVMTLLNENKIGQIRCGDSQLSPMNSMRYDRIVCEPPIMPKHDKSYLEMVPEDNYIYQDILDSETLALRHVLAKLKDNGLGIVLVPMGMLFKSGKVAEVRKRMLHDKFIDAIIELPGGVVPGTGVAFALLVLKKGKTNDMVYLLNARDFFERTDRISEGIDKGRLIISDGKIEQLASMYKNKTVLEGTSNIISADEIANNKYNLCTMQYVLLKPEDEIKVEDNTAHVNTYDILFKELEEVDKQLKEVRNRFLR